MIICHWTSWLGCGFSLHTSIQVLLKYFDEEHIREHVSCIYYFPTDFQTEFFAPKLFGVPTFLDTKVWHFTNLGTDSYKTCFDVVLLVNSTFYVWKISQLTTGCVFRDLSFNVFSADEHVREGCTCNGWCPQCYMCKPSIETMTFQPHWTIKTSYDIILRDTQVQKLVLFFFSQNYLYFEKYHKK